MPSRGATQDEMRRHNLSALLRRVHVKGAVSRAELTEWLGLNRSTVGDLVGELVSLGLLREDLPPHRIGAGRPSPIVRPESESVHVLSADIGVQAITVAIVGLGGTVTDRVEIPREENDAGPAAVAGTFYPGSAAELGTTVDALLRAVSSAVSIRRPARRPSGSRRAARNPSPTASRQSTM